jgi:hypothetical protein
MQKPCIYRIGCQRWLSRHLIALSLPIFAWLTLAPFSAAQSADLQQQTVCRSDNRKIIYVSDFDFDAANLKADKGGITGKGYVVPAPGGIPTMRRKPQDPETAADKYVKLMAESLVKYLQEAGFSATHLSSTDPRPTEGLLVTGVFSELNEGNQMRRALLGFGTGTAKMEVQVTMKDLSCAAAQQPYEAFAEKGGGKSPGGAVSINPYAGAAGFVAKFGMTKGAPEKMVKKTAAKIASELTKKIEADSLLGAEHAKRDH